MLLQTSCNYQMPARGSDLQRFISWSLSPGMQWVLCLMLLQMQSFLWEALATAALQPDDDEALDQHSGGSASSTSRRSASSSRSSSGSGGGGSDRVGASASRSSKSGDVRTANCRRSTAITGSSSTSSSSSHRLRLCSGAGYSSVRLSSHHTMAIRAKATTALVHLAIAAAVDEHNAAHTAVSAGPLHVPTGGLAGAADETTAQAIRKQHLSGRGRGHCRICCHPCTCYRWRCHQRHRFQQ